MSGLGISNENDGQKSRIALDEKSASLISMGDAEILFNVAGRLYAAGSYEGALKLFFIINLAYPTNVSFLAAYAKCLKLMKEYEQAAKIFKKAFSADTSTPEYALHAAECLLIAGKKKAANYILSSIVENTKHEQAHQALYAKAVAWKRLLEFGQDG